MQFDYNMLNKLVSLPDEQLWQTIRAIAIQSGVSLPDGNPPKAELSRLREALCNTKNPDLEEAMSIVNQYKKKNGI